MSLLVKRNNCWCIAKQNLKFNMAESKKYGMNTRAIHTKKIRATNWRCHTSKFICLQLAFEPGESEYFYGRINNPTEKYLKGQWPL